MQWYRYTPNSNEYRSLRLKTDDDESIVRIHYECRSVADTWTPVSIEGFGGDSGIEGDFPSLNNYSKIPVFSQQAWDVLIPLIGYCCEALPIVHPSGLPFYIINVMDIVDCVDEDRSELSRNATTGRVSRVYKFCLRHDLLEGKHILKTPLKCGADLLVSDEFRHLVEKHSLEGLQFRGLSLVNDGP